MDASALERALVARVSDRVRAAGESVDVASVEHIVRHVLARLEPADRPEAPPVGEPSLLVFVVEAQDGPAALPALRSALEAAAAEAGARVLAAHSEPTGA